MQSGRLTAVHVHVAGGEQEEVMCTLKGGQLVEIELDYQAFNKARAGGLV